MRQIYVSIGNSDNKLGQAEWSEFVHETEQSIIDRALRIHGAWFSRPDAQWQNACWLFEPKLKSIEELKDRLRDAGRFYAQDAIAWSEAETEFLS